MLMRRYDSNTEETEVARDIYDFTSSQLRVRSTLPITKAIRDKLLQLQRRIVKEEGGYLDRTVIVRSMIRAFLKHLKDLKDLGEGVSFEGIDTEAKLVEKLTALLKRK